MTEIFLVIMSDGEWSDHHSAPLRAWTTKQKADAHVAELEKEQVVHNTFVDLVRKLSSHYDANTPALAPFDSNKLKKEPKWNNLRKHEITVEMRAERDRIREHNQKIHQEYGELRGKWEHAKRKLIREQLVQNGAPQTFLDKYDHSGYVTDKTGGHSVEPIELD